MISASTLEGSLRSRRFFGAPYFTKHIRKTHQKTICYAARRRGLSPPTHQHNPRTSQWSALKKKLLKIVGLCWFRLRNWAFSWRFLLHSSLLTGRRSVENSYCCSKREEGWRTFHRYVSVGVMALLANPNKLLDIRISGGLDPILRHRDDRRERRIEIH